MLRLRSRPTSRNSSASESIRSRRPLRSKDYLWLRGACGRLRALVLRMIRSKEFPAGYNPGGYRSWHNSTSTETLLSDREQSLTAPGTELQRLTRRNSYDDGR